MNMPPPPEGFVLDEDKSTAVPPPPPGFELDRPKAEVPPPPPGFTLDAPPSAPPPSAAPVPSTEEAPVPPVPGALPARAPLPQRRPVEAFPPVQEMAGAPHKEGEKTVQDVPRRLPIRGGGAIAVDPETGEALVTAGEAGGTLTGEESWKAREDAISAAKAERDAAKERLDIAQVKSRAAATYQPRRGTPGFLRVGAIEDERLKAQTAYDEAEKAVVAAEKAPLQWMQAPASAQIGASSNVMAGIPEATAGNLRMADAVLGTNMAKPFADFAAGIRGANPTDPALADTKIQQLAEGAGSMVPFMVVGGVARKVGVPQWLASIIQGGGQEAEQFYREAEARGDEGMKKAAAYLSGYGIGATEALGSGRVMDQLDHLTGGGVKRYLGMVLKQAGEEGFQEGLQQLLENISKYALWGKDPGDITEGVANNALIGATLGAMTQGIISAPVAVSRRQGGGGIPPAMQAPVTPEDIERQVREGGLPGGPVPTPTPTPTPPPAGPGEAGGPNAPLPTNTPVTTVADGVATTTTLHGPADAYTIETTAEGKPILMPAPPSVTETLVGEGETKSTVLPNGTVVEGGVRPPKGETAILRETVEPEPGVSTGVPVEEPAIRKFGEEGPSQPVTGLYSRLQTWVQEKGPMNATAAQWISRLKRGDFRQEELRDLRLPEFLAASTGKVSKEEMVDYITAMTAPMVEVTRTPLTPEQRAAEETRLNAQIAAVVRADPTARQANGEVNWNHPVIGPLVDEIANINRNAKWARYEEQTTPGPRESYTELTLHLPERPAGPVPEPRGSIETSPDGKMHTVIIDNHRVTSFYDKGKAERTLKREMDIERKARQERAQRQANFIGGHYVTPNEIVTIRMTIRVDENGKRTLVIEEIQSDLHQTGKRQGYAAEGDIRGFHPRPSAAMPFKEGWAQLGFTRALMWAASQGITQVAWANSEEQMRRYPSGTTVQVAQRRSGMQAFYDRTVTSFAKKWAKRLGGTVMYTTIPGQSAYVARPMPVGVLGTTAVAPQWGVFEADPAATFGSNVPLRTYPTEAMAREFVEANTPREVRFRVLQLPSIALETISQGVPSYSMSVPSTPMHGPGAVFAAQQNVNKTTVEAIRPLEKALNALIKAFGLDTKVVIKLYDGTITYKAMNEKGQLVTKKWINTFGLAEHYKTKEGKFVNGIIHINVPMHKNAAHVWVTMVHELGHIIMYSIYQNAPLAVKRAVNAAFLAHKAKINAQTPLKDVISSYSNPVSAVLDPAVNPMPFGQMSLKDRNYWGGFNEFFAEMVSTWGSTRSKPLSVVEKFFAGIAKTITSLLQEAKKMFGLPYRGVAELNDFLDSFLATTDQQWGHDVNVATQQEGVIKNATQMSPEDTPAPPQPETITVAQGVGAVFNGRPPKEVQRALAYADKFNWLYKWALAIHQLAMKNPHIKSLQEYVETIRRAYHIKQQMMTKTEEILKRWNRLGETQADAVSAMLDDIQNMNYRTPDEVKNHISRHPTQAELLAIAQKHGVTKAGLAVVGEVGKSFQDFLGLYEKVLIDEANKISDPTRQQLKLAAITKQMAALRARPYFPSVRFGVYTLTIRDKAGKVIHFETFESKRDRARAANVIHSKYGIATSDMQLGLLDKEAKPLLGVPTQLLELMENKLNLSSIQRDALEQLKFELSPAQSFQHRFQHKRRIAGYSLDFRRAYAHYFFHGANHMMKAQFADRLRALKNMVVDEVKNAPDITKREAIEAFMTHHLDSWLDPKPDWAAVSSAAFMWGLAFSPMAAAMNLTQSVLTTWPHLGYYFGDANAVRVLANVGRKFTTFYSKGKLDQNAFETKAIFQGIEDGVIKETQAAEIAGIADGNILSRGYGGNYLVRGWTKFNEAGSFLFEMAEQVNRRLAFRAALQLTREQPNAKYVKEAVARHNLTYQQRRDEGWSEAEATAYVVAVDTVLGTQFQYGKQFAPRMFQGRKRSIFVFKTFVQSYLVFLTQNKGITIRSLLVLAAMGGLMGLPFADDLEDIIQMIAYRMFGKDFEPSKEVRKLILQMCGTTESGDMWADFAVHGIARKGFGLPWLLDMLSGTIGVDIPAPVFDVSRSVGMGDILPIQIGKMFGAPLQSPEKNIAEQAQRASGAVFGVGFSVYKALVNSQLNWSDAKRWEGMMPRAAASVSKAWRAYSEGGMRAGNQPSQIVKYDVRDNQQMAEVIGMAMGFTPYRQNYEWEKAMSKRDAEKTWDIRREALMRQFANATLGKDKQEKANVLEAIRTFNRELPPEAKPKAITGESLEKSVETRARDKALQERGLPRKTSSTLIFRQEEKLYPRSNRELRRVKPGMTPQGSE